MVSFSFARLSTGYCFFTGSQLYAQNAGMASYIRSTPSVANYVSSVSCSPSGDDWIICWDERSNECPTGDYHAHNISSTAYSELAAQLADDETNRTDPVFACSLGPAPYYYLRRKQSMSWSLPTECARDIRILQTLGPWNYLMDVAICQGGRAIYLFKNGFYLWNLDKSGADSQLHIMLQNNWSQGEHLEAADVALDVSGSLTGPARYFLRFGLTGFSARVDNSTLSKIQELWASPAESNLQQQLMMQLIGGMMARNADFRSGQMRRQMVQHMQDTGNESLSVAGMVDFLNLQHAMEVEMMIQSWIGGGRPQPRQGTGNMRNW